MAASKDTNNFFKKETYDETYWMNYLLARPEYSASFYNRIYDYHSTHQGGYETAVDIGTGPGQVAAELTQQFQHVLATDSNPTHLEVAAHRLTALITAKKVSLAECSAEGTADPVSASSVDLITAAECFPLVDAATALQAFRTVLRPRGTVAIWFYGRPAFAEPEFTPTCQPLLDRILDICFTPAIKGSGPQRKLAWKRATDRMASFLDDVELPASEWEDVRRYKWNTHLPMPFYGAGACNFDITPSSAVAETEIVSMIDDLAIWERGWDVADARRFVLANLPTFDEANEDDTVRGLYKELETAMGGSGAKRKITWPVVLILGSKK
jgi:trans-aconitate 3-methyltransferase